MVVLLVTSCVALFLVYFASRDEIPYGLELAFFLIAFIAAIHYEYGSDYPEYARMFVSISNLEFDWASLVDRKIYREPGWALLNYFFRPFGFLSLVFFLGFFQNFVYYLFIKRIVPKEWWVMGGFIYLFSDSLWVLNMSMMRQGLAVTLFVLAWLVYDFDKRKIWISILLVFVATTVHFSAIFLYPCLMFFFVKKNMTRFIAVGIGICFILFFAKPELCNQFFALFVDAENVNRYLMNYRNLTKDVHYGIGFIFMLIPFVTMIYSLVKNENLKERELQCVVLATVAYLIFPFRNVIPMADRLGYYFSAFSISAVPIVYKSFSKWYRFFLVSMFVILYIVSYFRFFYSSVWNSSYMQFHSIFEVIF